jgi:hypothetical protein
MGNITKLFFAATVLSSAAASHAFFYSNLASGDLGLTGQSNAQTLTVGGPGIGNAASNANFTIDFFPSSGNILAGDGSNRAFQLYSFTYEVLNTSNTPTGAVGIVVQGVVSGSGFVSVQEDVYSILPNNSEVLVGSMSNAFSATGPTQLNRGSLTRSGVSFSYVDNAPVVPAQSRYKIKKTFFVQVNANWNPNVDFAGISLIQQTHQPVPEPATIAVMGLGAAALIRRRRKAAK